MASSQTSNYGLNQWAAEDRVLREEFNQDNAKLDNALQTIPRFVNGSYVGTGKSGKNNPCVLNLGFQPKMLILNTQELDTYNGVGKYYFLFPGVTSFPVPDSNSYNTLLWRADGVSWYYTSYSSSDTDEEKAYWQYNTKGKTYSYIAVIW